MTLTRHIYMAEHPITQEIYEAVMGNNPSMAKNPKMPVSNVDCANMYRFCQVLGEKTKTKIRIPTAAEWEYAARVLEHPIRHLRRNTPSKNSNATDSYNSLPLPVKSPQANPWGFLRHAQLAGGARQRQSDHGTQGRDRPDLHSPQDEKAEIRSTKHGHFGKGQFTYEISEVEYIDSSAGPYRFRIVVEPESDKAH